MDLDHSNHEQVAETAAAYALDALDPEDASAFRQHLPTCVQCSRAVAEMRAVVNVLPYSVEPVEPPPHVKQRLMERVRVLAPAAPARPVGPEPQRGRGFWSFLTGRALPLATAATAVLLLLSLGAVVLQQRNQIEDLRAQLSQVQQVQSLITSPETQVRDIATNGVRGKMFMAPDSERAYIAISGLPPLPEGRDYQVWLMEDGQPASVGVFDDQSGRWILEANRPLGAYEGLGITQEPEGGSQSPTTDPVLGLDL